jgi:anaerobic selenocysteine-containing dehydrogenase
MAASRDSIKNVWGDRTPYFGDWPVRVDERTHETPERWVQSACVLCSNGCGIDIGVREGRIVGVRGRQADRVNRGRLGPKGLHGWEANAAADRLRAPLIRHGNSHREATWDDAMNAIVERTKEILATSTSAGIAFYSSGQLFLEEYYTLAVIGKAGLGTIHMDGNTRLCTATAAAALRESFGSDGQPASFSDIDTADALFLVGHNMASQQTVLWNRILDRLAGPHPPQLVVVDPRRTETASKATVHLAPRLGTNVALLNGILHTILERGWFDREYVEAHAVGFDGLEETVRAWTPERAAQICEVPLSDLQRAAEIVGTSPRLVSTALQGVYQSHQATAAACQVNNIHIIRGMLGKPGCGVFQMNGQPSAQNTRETGANGEYPAFRNHQNAEDMEDLARVWNVEPKKIPHWAHPTHIMQIMKFCEEDSIKMLWIVATNPAVTLPDLNRIRKILKKPGLFVVVQDAFMTETAQYADVVLPAAIWGEKTGTYTNADRTVHISHKAIDPPGAARSDLDIFLDYARRMGFRDKDGAPLIKWTDAESAFEAWKMCTAGRFCDYTGLTYAKLSEGSGIQWPCNARAPEGTERLYSDGIFNTAYATAEDYGHDLTTGALVTPQKYKAFDPGGKAIIKPSDYEPPIEQPDSDYPFFLTTGRIVYHFHTRTKTARASELNAAAPDAFIEMSQEDAGRYGAREGALLEIRSRRGRARARIRIAPIKPGTLFMPFHYGYFDDDERSARAANELTLAEWDPVSKQPYFKYAAVKISSVEK